MAKPFERCVNALSRFILNLGSVCFYKHKLPLFDIQTISDSSRHHSQDSEAVSTKKRYAGSQFRFFFKGTSQMIQNTFVSYSLHLQHI